MTARPSPHPPAVLEEWIDRWAGPGGTTRPRSAAREVGEHESPSDLLPRAIRALEHALARPGRDRDAAQALLAADHLLTLACERAADAADPETALRDVLDHILRVP